MASAARGTATKNPLYVPPVVDVGGLTTAFDVTQAPGLVNLGDRQSRAWMYNGTLPGPTFRAGTGESVQFTLHNGLSEPTTTHWHGMVVDHPNDGHPVYAINPGARTATPIRSANGRR